MWYYCYCNNKNELDNYIEEIVDSFLLSQPNIRLSGAGLRGLAITNTLKLVSQILKLKFPQYNLPIDALLHFISGSGKDQKIPDKYIYEMAYTFYDKAFMIWYENNKDKEDISFYKNRQLIPPDLPIQFLWTHVDYNNKSDYLTGEEEYDPLYHTVGGFTCTIETKANGDKFDVYFSMEDRYDWDSNADTNYDIEKLGIKDIVQKIINNPKISEYLNNKGFVFANNMVTIDDSFWNHIKEFTGAKEYTNYWNGKIMSIDANGYKEYLTNDPQKNSNKDFNDEEILLSKIRNGEKINNITTLFEFDQNKFNFLIDNGYKLTDDQINGIFRSGELLFANPNNANFILKYLPQVSLDTLLTNSRLVGLLYFPIPEIGKRVIDKILDSEDSYAILTLEKTMRLIHYPEIMSYFNEKHNEHLSGKSIDEIFQSLYNTQQHNTILRFIREYGEQLSNPERLIPYITNPQIVRSLLDWTKAKNIIINSNSTNPTIQYMLDKHNQYIQDFNEYINIMHPEKTPDLTANESMQSA